MSVFSFPTLASCHHPWSHHCLSVIESPSMYLNVHLKLIATAVTHVVVITLALLCHLFPCLLTLCAIIIAYTRFYGQRLQQARTSMYTHWCMCPGHPQVRHNRYSTRSILQAIGCAMLKSFAFIENCVSMTWTIGSAKPVPFWSVHFGSTLP